MHVFDAVREKFEKGYLVNQKKMQVISIENLLTSIILLRDWYIPLQDGCLCTAVKYTDVQNEIKYVRLKLKTFEKLKY